MRRSDGALRVPPSVGFAALSYSGSRRFCAASPPMERLRQTALLVVIVVATFTLAFVMGGWTR
jgi:hypothetical protein